MDGQTNSSPDRSTHFPTSAEVSNMWRTATDTVENHLHTSNDGENDDVNGKRTTTFPTSDEVGDIAQKTSTVEMAIQRANPAKRRRRVSQQLQIPITYTVSAEKPAKKHPKLPFCKNNSPWMRYEKVRQESKPGKTCIANAIDSPGMLVAIKEYKKGGIDKAFHLQMTDHMNIVNLLDAFEESKTIYLVYELMEVSLQQLQSCVELKESDLGFIAKELLHGLWYIHRDLAVCHTAVTSDNIFISSRGNVKIANIATSLLERHQGSEQLDIKSIGRILCEIRDPGNTLIGRRQSGLHISSGSDQLKAFISKTAHTGISALLQDVFISHAAGEGCLVVPVFKIRALILHDYD